MQGIGCKPEFTLFLIAIHVALNAKAGAVMASIGGQLVVSATFLAAIFGAAALAQSPSVSPELDQGWSQLDRAKWYRASQGSRLIPWDWFQNLETKEGGERFAAMSNLSRYGYLPAPGASPDDLPIGFAKDVQSDERLVRTRVRWKADQGDEEPWLGLTCAACHTGSVESKDGKAFLVDGGQSHSDFQSFMEAFNAALEDTRADPDKWSRFAARVLPDGDGDDALKQAFDMLLQWQRKEAIQNTAPIRYGPSRIDAFGHIFNKVALTLDYDHAKPNPADAPVSIPYIWRAPQLDAVQYDGLVPKKVVGNIDFGALGRNAGEVIGVFGDVVARPSPGAFNGFTSSLRVEHLIGLEDLLGKLKPPKWPAQALGAPDVKMAAKGKDLVAVNCETAMCHQPVKRDDLTTQIKPVRLLFSGVSPGTDPWMACNAVAYTSSSGPLSGYKNALITNGTTFGSDERLAVLLEATVKAALLDKKTDILQAAFDKLFNRPLIGAVAAAVVHPNLPPADPRRTPEKERQLRSCLIDSLFGYTSRPLSGVWASAPYLHNGSVPTLYALLLPPDQRPKHFKVGTRLYDTKNMGFRTEDDVLGNTFDFKAADDVGPIDGNSNYGHDYNNAGFTDEQRYQIIEYLKTL